MQAEVPEMVRNDSRVCLRHNLCFPLTLSYIRNPLVVERINLYLVKVGYRYPQVYPGSTSVIPEHRGREGSPRRRR